MAVWNGSSLSLQSQSAGDQTVWIFKRWVFRSWPFLMCLFHKGDRAPCADGNVDWNISLLLVENKIKWNKTHTFVVAKKGALLSHWISHKDYWDLGQLSVKAQKIKTVLWLKQNSLCVDKPKLVCLEFFHWELLQNCSLWMVGDSFLQVLFHHIYLVVLLKSLKCRSLCLLSFCCWDSIVNCVWL